MRHIPVSLVLVSLNEKNANLQIRLFAFQPKSLCTSNFFLLTKHNSIPFDDTFIHIEYLYLSILIIYSFFVLTLFSFQQLLQFFSSQVCTFLII
jgi:hypothetical protein